jgi:hypothetical protein
MNTVVKLVIFTVLINIAAGILMVGVVDSNGNPIFDSSTTQNFRYDDNFGNLSSNTSASWMGDLQEPVNPSGTQVESAGDRIYRVLDTLSLGFIYRFINWIETYMFGFVSILDNVIGTYMEEDLRVFLFGEKEANGTLGWGVFQSIIALGYVIVGISFFTGKNITGEE